MKGAKTISKDLDWGAMVTRARQRDLKSKGRKKKLDYDIIAYGISRSRGKLMR